MEVVIIIILCPLLHLFWGRNNQCQLKRAADRQTTTDSVNKLTWWGERVRGETKHWGERKSEKDRKRDLSLFSLYPHRKTTMVSKGAAILAPSFTQVHGSRIFDSQCIVSKCVAICCFARALFCGSHLHITAKRQILSSNVISRVNEYNECMFCYFRGDPRQTMTTCVLAGAECGHSLASRP